MKLNTRALGGDFGFLSDSYKADWFRRLSLYAIWSVSVYAGIFGLVLVTLHVQSQMVRA